VQSLYRFERSYVPAWIRLPRVLRVGDSRESSSRGRSLIRRKGWRETNRSPGAPSGPPSLAVAGVPWWRGRARPPHSSCLDVSWTRAEVLGPPRGAAPDTLSSPARPYARPGGPPGLIGHEMARSGSIVVRVAPCDDALARRRRWVPARGAGRGSRTLACHCQGWRIVQPWQRPEARAEFAAEGRCVGQFVIAAAAGAGQAFGASVALRTP